MRPQPLGCGNLNTKGFIAFQHYTFNEAATVRLRKLTVSETYADQAATSFNEAATVRLRKWQYPVKV